MGYPMTFQRFVHRNGMTEGGYGAQLSQVNTEPWTLTADDFQAGVDFTEVQRKHIEFLASEIKRLSSHWGSVLGDLRRLEKDATDEGAGCRYIAQRTGIDPEVVAAVLKEFIAW